MDNEPPQPLAGNWTLAGAPGSQLELQQYGITLEFRDGAVGGRSGVNRYRGQVQVIAQDDDRRAGMVGFGPLATTLMAGPPAAMAAESGYLALLSRVTGYRLSDSELELLVDGQTAIRFQPGQGLLT